MSSSLFAAVVVVVAGLAACATSGSIRQLRREDSGGAYQLEGDEAKARAALERSMQRHCGAGNYEEVPATGGSARPREVAYRCVQAPSAVPAVTSPTSGGGGVY